MGQCDLENLTGLNPNQQRRIVKKLKNKGYIRSVIEGNTYSGIFGQVNSIYCLNPCIYPDVGSSIDSLVIYKSPIVANQQWNGLSEAYQLIHYASSSYLSGGGHNAEKKIYSRMLDVGGGAWGTPVEKSHLGALKGKHDKSFIDYLQFRLETYACWFLHHELPGNDRHIFVDERFIGIYSNIKEEVKAGCKTDLSRKEADKFARVLFQVALNMARSYEHFLDKYGFSALDGDVRKQRVLPRVNGTILRPTPSFITFVSSNKSLTLKHEMVITSVRRDNKEAFSSKDKVLSPQKNHDYIVAQHECEDDIDPQLRIDCGLLSPCLDKRGS